MKNFTTKIRNKGIELVYQGILKKIFFKIDPETIHDRMLKLLKLAGYFKITQKAVTAMLSYSNKKLSQKILGIKFKNPIGLAAGFDKNAELTQILPSMGFGFEEVGSITGEPCEGNAKPRLWRLKKSKGLVVYYGLKNDGCEKIAKRLENKKFKFPVGISIAKTNCKLTANIEEGIKDYVKAYRTLKNIGDYITINISCPNAYGGEPFTDAKSLELLLTETDKVDSKKPRFLKLLPDLTHEQIDEIIKITKNHKIDGFVCTNLTKNRKNKKITEKDVPKNGGISGKPMEQLSTETIRYIYQKTQGKYVIIGCGGVFSAEDAYKKIKAGASLIQLITGFIFEGPQVLSEINRGLVKLLEDDGFKNISEAIGIEA